MMGPTEPKLTVVEMEVAEPEKVIAFLNNAIKLVKEHGYTFCAIAMSNGSEFNTSWCSEKRSGLKVLGAAGLIQYLLADYTQRELLTIGVSEER